MGGHGDGDAEEIHCNDNRLDADDHPNHFDDDCRIDHPDFHVDGDDEVGGNHGGGDRLSDGHVGCDDCDDAEETSCENVVHRSDHRHGELARVRPWWKDALDVRPLSNWNNGPVR